MFNAQSLSFPGSANSESVSIVRELPIKIKRLNEGIRLLLSSYTKGIQVQEGYTGNLFQQKTKSKDVDSYLPTAFHYIHQNPLKAGLVQRMENYRWSSFTEYYNSSPSRELCNKKIFYEFVGIS